MSNRRAFLQFAGLAPAAAATVGLAASAAAPPAVKGPLTRSLFLACVGDEFRFESGPHDSVSAKLARVCALELGARKLEAEGMFRLEFEPLEPGTLAQETYAVTHARLGRIVLFVSPNDAKGRVVEAVFNNP